MGCPYAHLYDVGNGGEGIPRGEYHSFHPKAFDHLKGPPTALPPLLQSATPLSDLLEIPHDAFTLAVQICILFIAATFISSTATGNYSQVDRVWSITPVVYVWVFAAATWLRTGYWDERGVAIAVAVSVWGARLTWNFARKGGYSRGSEDHRWPMLRKIIGNGVAWHLFNFFFISCYQNVLLLLISVPAYIVHRAAVLSPVHLRIATPAPAISLAVFAFLLIFEAIADAQQWAFQTKKYAAIAESKKTGVPVKPPYAKGFLAEGLFRLSRHPNYFAEIGMWWCVYAYSVAAQWEGRLLTKNWIRDYINWSMCGAVLLTLLFEGSTAFTEWISAKKYPAYKLYQQTTSVLVPMWPGPKIESLETKDKKEK